MRQIEIKELTLDSFSMYGSFANMINPRTIKFGAEPIEFFRDMVQLNLGYSSIASFSVCRVTKREPVIDVSEVHSYCGEGILPLDGDILIHVAPAAPAMDFPADAVEVFRIPRGTMVTLRPGVWHHAPFAHDCDYVNVVIVLPERTYANDCTVSQPAPQDRVAIR